MKILENKDVYPTSDVDIKLSSFLFLRYTPFHLSLHDGVKKLKMFVSVLHHQHNGFMIFIHQSNFTGYLEFREHAANPEGRLARKPSYVCYWATVCFQSMEAHGFLLWEFSRNMDKQITSRPDNHLRSRCNSPTAKLEYVTKIAFLAKWCKTSVFGWLLGAGDRTGTEQRKQLRPSTLCVMENK